MAPKTKEYEIYHQSVEFLPVAVDTDHDPTSDAVYIACVAIGTDPVTGDWKTGSWDIVDDDYTAKIMFGTDISLDAGQYDVYIKITDAPEVPIIRVGLLTVT